jgi:uncharacterized protein YdeI (YjbR/CyaY-like superfamily)
MGKSLSSFYAKDRAAWRRWLKANHKKEKNVWLILHKKNSNTPSVTYVEAVEESLCFGWIDSVANKRDADSFLLYFAVRKSGGVWSKINKGRIERLIKDGLMMPEGQRRIDEAKDDGSWSKLDPIEDNKIPAVLKKALSKNKKALKHFEAFPPSARKHICQWVISAKREETLKKRIEETVTLAEKNIRANQWKPKK